MVPLDLCRTMVPLAEKRRPCLLSCLSWSHQCGMLRCLLTERSAPCCRARYSDAVLPTTLATKPELFSNREESESVSSELSQPVTGPCSPSGSNLGLELTRLQCESASLGPFGLVGAPQQNPWSAARRSRRAQPRSRAGLVPMRLGRACLQAVTAIRPGPDVRRVRVRSGM